MSASNPTSPTGRIIGRCPFATAVILLVIGTGRADAALVIEVPGLSSQNRSERLDAEAHARDCGCATKCRGRSCCCGKAALAAPKSKRPDDSLPTNPCFESAPCGDSNPPMSLPPSLSLDKSATLASVSAIEALRGLGRLAPGEFLLIPADRACRLERPPDLRPSRNL